jgi:hypothetical protein
MIADGKKGVSLSEIFTFTKYQPMSTWLLFSFLSILSYHFITVEIVYNVIFEMTYVKNKY